MIEQSAITILALDDDPADLELLSRDLGEIPDFQIDLLTFTDWEAARKCLASRSVDLIILDYHLGRTTGLEVLEELKDMGRDKPVIILTGAGDENIAVESIKKGAGDYLTKGKTTADNLKRSIKSVLRQYQLERKNRLLTESLLQAQKMEAIGTLAGGLAHDFNNMLTAVMGYNEIARLKSAGRDVVKELDQVHSVCRQMAGLVERLLSFGRRDISSYNDVDISRILQDVEVVLRHSVAKNISIDIQVLESPLIVSGSAASIQQIIMNLCLNAADAMAEGGRILVRAGTLLVDNDLVLQHPNLNKGKHVYVTVQDSGSGIPDSIRDNIFDPFFSTKEKSAEKGTGMGLALVWQNIKELNGHLSLYSELNVGTTFRFYLPATIKEEDMGEVINRQGVFPKGSGSILVVDDEELIRDIACSMLQHIGYTAYTATDGLNAIETYTELRESIDLVLLDMSMPTMTGPECLKQLLKIDPSIKVLMASGHDMDIEKEALFKSGAQGVMQKPYQLHDLASRLKMVLGNTDIR